MEHPSSSEERLTQLEKRISEVLHFIQLLTRRICLLEQRLSELVPTAGSVSHSKEPEDDLPLTPPILASPLSQRADLSSVHTAELKTGRPRLTSGSWEARIGGSRLIKIAIVSIFLGMVFSLKYALDNNYIGVIGRVLLGVVVGILFLLFGERLKPRIYRASALAISGGGLAILYLSIFAAFSLYQLIDQLPALLIMVLITITAALLALRHDSLVIAVLGVVGGFLTPILLGTGVDNQIRLFSYLILLDFGILALAFYKNWRGLNLLAFVLTQFMFLAWVSQFYHSSKLGGTIVFLTLFFFVFAFISFLHNRTHQKQTTPQDLSLILLNGTAYFLWTYLLLRLDHLDYLGFFSVVVAIIYLGFMLLARHYSLGDIYSRSVLLGLALISLSLAIPIQFEPLWIPLGWAVEATLLTWVGFRVESDKTRWAALFIAALVVPHLLFDDHSLESLRPLINPWFLSSASYITAVFFMAALYAKNREILSRKEEHVIAPLVLVGAFLLLFSLSNELAHFFDQRWYLKQDLRLRLLLRNQEQLAISTLWATYSFVLVVVGMVKQFRPIRLLAMVIFGLTTIKVFLVDLREMDKLYRIIVSLGLGGILLGVSLLYQRYWQRLDSVIRK